MRERFGPLPAVAGHFVAIDASLFEENVHPGRGGGIGRRQLIFIERFGGEVG